MATIATPQRRPLVSKFYVTMAGIFVAIAFVQLSRPMLSRTEAWYGFADFLLTF